MSQTLERIQELIALGEVRISVHGYDELANDDLRTRDIMMGVVEAIVVEDYPDFPKGPAVLVLQYDAYGDPIHVVWGIPYGKSTPAVLVTAYRPDATRWSSDFKRRRP